jgi:hypothetical protein
MRRFSIPLTVALLLCAGGLSPNARLLADPGAPPPVSPDSLREVATTPVALTPEMAAIRGALDEGRARVDALAVRLAAMTDNDACFALQREIELAKRDTELQVLSIQVDFARREKRGETAAELEAVIAQIRNPQVTPVVVNRPAPERGADKR